jgi:membrane associated rhomboid family serine protease
LGPGRYIFFYLLTGIIGTVAHVITAPGSQIPLIGASGAIAGVLGAYFVTFPGSRVLTLIPIFLLLTTVEIPAVAFLAFWFILQLFNGVGSLSPGAVESTAWWAHIGGFAAGALLMRVLSPRRPRREPGWGGSPEDGSWGPSA